MPRTSRRCATPSRPRSARSRRSLPKCMPSSGVSTRRENSSMRRHSSSRRQNGPYATHIPLSKRRWRGSATPTSGSRPSRRRARGTRAGRRTSPFSKRTATRRRPRQRARRRMSLRILLLGMASARKARRRQRGAALMLRWLSLRRGLPPQGIQQQLTEREVLVRRGRDASDPSQAPPLPRVVLAVATPRRRFLRRPPTDRVRRPDRRRRRDAPLDGPPRRRPQRR
mmetsp:Transcript_21395/g.85089  ORF Transcript_21395/g.85089 Transcript_21395/m.85089 type:complete len:226 (-) Transcript_21395:254-931(-)